ncbi:hypothetical protein ACYULU_00340 [Breznakiellaceae bacterium SP9]
MKILQKIVLTLLFVAYLAFPADAEGKKDSGDRVESGFMAGFTSTLPDVDDSGEKFMGYKKTDNYERRVYGNGEKIEDFVTHETEFDEALKAFQKLYRFPIPRRNAKLRGATNLYRTNDVPRDFPKTYWASITIEGRYMRVIIANGPLYRLAVSYWAQEEFMREYPNASWSWAGEDAGHSRRSGEIQEDFSLTAEVLEFSE